MTVYYKVRQKFITKCDRSLLQNALPFLLQNATVLLQNAIILLQNPTVIKKCDVYYKLRRYKDSHVKIASSLLADFRL